MKNLTAIVLLLLTLSSCVSPFDFGKKTGNYLVDGKFVSMTADEAESRRDARHAAERSAKIAAAKIQDRSDMTFDQLREHLRECRQVSRMPRDYVQAVIKDVVAKSDWTENERAQVREQEIRVGFTEDQVRVAWGDPRREHRTLYSFGEIKYLHYFASTTIHLKNGRVSIIDSH